MTTERNLEVAKECGACTLQQPNEELPYSISFGPEELDAYTARILAEKDAEIERYKRIESKVQSHITDIEQRLSAANAAIAMKDEALKEASSTLECFKYSLDGVLQSKLLQALSLTPESLAAWKAEKQKQWLEERKAKLFAMLHLADGSAVRLPTGVEYAITTMVEPLQQEVETWKAACYSDRDRHYAEVKELQKKLDISSKEIERLNALVAMQAEALKIHHELGGYTSGDLFRITATALFASSETVEAFMSEHDAKVLESLVTELKDGDECERYVAIGLKGRMLNLRETKQVKE